MPSHVSPPGDFTGDTDQMKETSPALSHGFFLKTYSSRNATSSCFMQAAEVDGAIHLSFCDTAVAWTMPQRTLRLCQLTGSSFEEFNLFTAKMMNDDPAILGCELAQLLVAY
jgi:hypothetical protein